MDRSQNIRRMMKEAMGGADSDSKDKVKALKMMRLQQQSIPSHPPTKVSIAETPSISRPPENAYLPVEITMSKSGVPDPVPDNRTGSASQPTSQLPAGFFDDIIQDTYARGLDPVKILREDKEKQARDLGAFFEEVGALDEELGAVVEQDEEQRREQEDQAVQMSYMVRLAHLYQRADRKDPSSIAVNETDEVIDRVLPNRSVDSAVLSTTGQRSSEVAPRSAPSDNSSESDNVFSVMRKQRLERKRLREQARIDSDIIDAGDQAATVLDWTAKSI